MKFFIKDYFSINSESEIDVSQIPPIARRKLSLLDKAAITTMNKLFNENIQELVFSSEYGEFSRLDLLISQYQQEGEVSPSNFSSSVHNHPVGFFTMMKKQNIPYYAISAGKNSFQAGFIKSLISQKETLYTYTDVSDGVKSISMIISQKL